MKWFTSRQFCKSSNVLSKFLSISHPILAEKTRQMEAWSFKSRLAGRFRQPEAAAKTWTGWRLTHSTGIQESSALGPSTKKTSGIWRRITPHLFWCKNVIWLMKAAIVAHLMKPEFLIENFPTRLVSRHWLVSRHDCLGFLVAKNARLFLKVLTLRLLWLNVASGNFNNKAPTTKKPPADKLYRSIRIFTVAEVFFSVL